MSDAHRELTKEAIALAVQVACKERDERIADLEQLNENQAFMIAEHQKEIPELERELAEARKPRRGDEWHESDGNVLWFCEPIDEPPYCGSPLDQDFPWVSTNLSDIRWVPLPAIFRMADEQGGEDDE